MAYNPARRCIFALYAVVERDMYPNCPQRYEKKSSLTNIVRKTQSRECKMTVLIMKNA